MMGGGGEAKGGLKIDPYVFKIMCIRQTFIFKSFKIKFFILPISKGASFFIAQRPNLVSKETINW